MFSSSTGSLRKSLPRPTRLIQQGRKTGPLQVRRQRQARELAQGGEDIHEQHPSSGRRSSAAIKRTLGLAADRAASTRPTTNAAAASRCSTTRRDNTPLMEARSGQGFMGFHSFEDHLCVASSLAPAAGFGSGPESSISPPSLIIVSWFSEPAEANTADAGAAEAAALLLISGAVGEQDGVVHEVDGRVAIPALGI